MVPGSEYVGFTLFSLIGNLGYSLKVNSFETLGFTRNVKDSMMNIRSAIHDYLNTPLQGCHEQGLSKGKKPAPRRFYARHAVS